MKHLYTLFVTLFLAVAAMGQTSISGTTKDSAQQVAIPYVNITLYKAADMKTPVKSLYSDKDGRFAIVADTGSYTLVLTHAAFAKRTISVWKKEESTDLGAIHMSPATGQLGNVTVQATRPLIEQSSDKVIYNVENDPAAKTENASDILRKTPLVTVDGEGNVQLNGQSNFKILLNGKETAMFAQNVKEALKGFPGALIVKIEVITSPSAKYDAEGVGGIINIITKKKVVGFNGSLSSYYSTINNYSESINLNIKTGKMGITGFYSLSGVQPQKSFALSETEAFDPTVFAKRSFDGIRTRKSFYNSGNLEISYELDSLNTLVAYGNLSGGHSKSLLDQQILTTFTSAPSIQSRLLQNVVAEYPSSGVGADYTRKFARNPEQELSIRFNGQFSRNEDINTSIQENPGQDRFVLNNSESNNKEYTLQLDFVKPLRKGQRLETGAKVIARRAESDFESLLKYDQTEAYKNNPFNTDRFRYHQEVYSGYGSYSATWKKFNVRLGLRLEHTLIDGDFVTSKTQVEQAYTKLIPNVHISRKFTPVYTATLSYNQRLQRPYITNLNPFVNNNDSLNIYYGNPNLGPQVLHTFSLQNRIVKGKTFMNVMFNSSYSNSLITQYVDYNKLTGVTSTTSGNVGEEWQFSLMLNANTSIGKKLNGFVSVMGRYNTIENKQDKTQQVEGFGVSAFTGFSYKATQKFTISGSGGVNQMPQNLLNKYALMAFYQVNLGYKVIGEKLSVTANFNNMHSQYFDYKTTIENANFRTVNTSRNLYRVVYFGATWRFGKLKEQASKKKGITNDDLLQNQSNG